MKLSRNHIKVLIGVIVLVILFLMRDIVVRHQAQAGEIVTNQTAGLTYKMPRIYKAAGISEEEKKIGMVVKLLRNDPIAQISVRIDPNMPLEAGISNTNIDDYLQHNVAELYQQYPKYNKVSTDSVKLMKQPANELVFTYQALDNKTTFKVDVIAQVINGKPYFFEFQSPETYYNSLQAEWLLFRRSLITQ